MRLAVHLIFALAFSVCGIGEGMAGAGQPAEHITETPAGASIWQHNGSEVRLVAAGDSRSILYWLPREGLRGLKVTRDTVLFQGREINGEYTGTVSAFSTRCGGWTYEVKGAFANGKLVLRGQRPVPAADCQVARTFNDVLVFSFVRGSSIQDLLPQGDTLTVRPLCKKAQCVDRDLFIEAFNVFYIGAEKKSLDASQIDAFNALLNVWDLNTSFEMKERLAYILATVKHETFNLIYPIRECKCKDDAGSIGCVRRLSKMGAASPYYQKDSVTDRSYYGRGQIALTLKEQYERIGKLLGMGDRLVADPDLSLDLDVSARIAVFSLYEGWLRQIGLKHLVLNAGGGKIWEVARDVAMAKGRHADRVARDAKAISEMITLAPLDEFQRKYEVAAQQPVTPVSTGPAVDFKHVWPRNHKEHSWCDAKYPEPEETATDEEADAEEGLDVVDDDESKPEFSLSWDRIPEGVKRGSFVLLNGRKQRVTAVERDKQLITLEGDVTDLQKGLNLLESDARQFRFWSEQSELKAFEEPYKNSYAVVAAIDDYDRSKDPLKRGKSGYDHLEGMVERAKEFKAELARSGFDESKIITLFDEDATSTSLNDTLAEFWQGGKYEDADRVVIYFGGHGAGEEDSGYLVTYDIDPKRPTRTGFLMSDFVNRHFPNIRARHVFVALDACSSGLSIPGTLSSAAASEELERFATLANIRRDAEKRARDILVAGTGNQRALTQTGGIFTQALVRGLRSEADVIKDGVVQFDELSLYVKRQVTAKAAEVGARQDPKAFSATRYGEGKILFLLSGQDSPE